MAMKREQQGQRLTRREREKMRHRREILEAAERVFADRGFEAATVLDVAREADFSVGAIYNFFPGKEALFAEVMNKIAEDFDADFQTAIERADNALEAIREVVLLRLRKMEQHGAFLRRLTESRPGSRAFPDHAIPESCRERYAAYLRRLAGLFATAMANGHVRTMDPLYSALTLEGAINAYSAYWVRNGQQLPLAERADVLYRNCLSMMLLNKGDAP